MTPATYAIAIGSNRRHALYGAPDRVVATAIGALGMLGTVEAESRIVRTPALGPAGRDFANAAVILTTELPPPVLLDALKAIERRFGRRRGRRWGARVLDLDIILWSGGLWTSPGLVVPHSEFRARDFVLRPLGQIAPDWRDPLTGRTVRQLRARLTRRTPTPR